MQKLKNVIRNFDVFGYPVLLNFDKKGNFHKTLVGGYLTLLTWFCMIVYFIYGSLKISNHE